MVSRRPGRPEKHQPALFVSFPRLTLPSRRNLFRPFYRRPQSVNGILKTAGLSRALRYGSKSVTSPVLREIDNNDAFQFRLTIGLRAPAEAASAGAIR